ncbi:hypothetical protein [Streptomyces fuscichromogenes]|uniref:Lipoprotein n=1 Tax=Streptomyces fuscichromogenes TaxID=1324013 RepID=A0A917XMG6_9ACTN|nr:hypothetical protein [Streptomyces fuscichromogenes]GGN39637.1 lipoprotein [Streptomyces fuscichromogenes]
MRAIRVASAALLGVGALALSAPAILASDSGDGGRDATPFGFRVTPATVAAGGRVSLHLDRGGGCRGTARVTSGVFDTVSIPSERDSVTATVDRNAKPKASYRVTFDCDGSTLSTELAIADGKPAGGGDGHTGGRTDEHGDEDGNGRADSGTDGQGDGRTGAGTDSGSGSGESLNPQPIPPGRGVQAGEGGSIGGFDLQELGLGTALVVGSVGTAYRLSRRRADEDGGA